MTPVETDHYASSFRIFEKETGLGPPWLRPIRREAFSRFTELGFPTVRQEAWRFTDVKPIAGSPFRPAAGYRPNGLGADTLEPFLFPGLRGPRITFVNGHFAQDLSLLADLPGGLRVGSLARVLSEDPAAVEPFLARSARFQDHPFVALNTAFLRDGAFVFLPKGRVVPEPIHLLFLSTGSRAPEVSHPRNLIVAEEGSQAEIIESYAGLEEKEYFTNSVTEIVVGPGAMVDHCKLQQESARAFHMATLQTRQEGNSSFTSHSVSLGGALVRNDLNLVLDGEGVDCALNGLYVVAGRQVVDHHTMVDHAKPHGTSVELYKGILDESSRGVFHGKIIVRQDAQKTNARQTNKNLVLSEEARINTQPQLEIYADDVKCTHGATIGQLDPQALYYLRSRGIDPEDARTLLTYGFISDVIGRIRCEPVRAQLECLLLMRVREAARLRNGS